MNLGLVVALAFATVVLFAYVILTVRDARRESAGIREALAIERAENARLAEALFDCHKEQTRVEVENRKLAEQVRQMSER